MIKTISIKTYLNLILLCFPLSVLAGPTTIEAKLDSTNLLMGKQVGLQIEIVQDKNATGYIPIVDGDTLTRNVEIVGWSKSDTTDLKNNRIQINKELLLQSFDSGLYVLPPILYVSQNDTFRTKRLTLKVIPVDVDSLKDIHGYKTVESPNTKWTDYLPDFITDYWWIISIVCALLAIAAYLIYRWKKGKPIVPIIQKKKLLPPYEEAVAALAELKSALLWENGQEKEYYTRLTDILRHYIDRRFDVNAMEMTSTQILSLLEEENAKDELRKILNIADFVKFAKMKPLADENQQAFKLAAEFLDKTKPIDLEKEDNGEIKSSEIKEPKENRK